MAAALVQSSPVATQASATTITTTFGAAPTSGNLLIWNIHTRSSTLTNPTGFTTAISVLNGTNNDILRQAHKVSDGSETSIQGTGMEGAGADTLAIAHEFSGMVTTSVEDQEASAAFTSPGGTSRQVGPTSAASQNEVVYIAALGLRGAAISAESVNNGYTLVGNGDVAGSTHLLDAYKIVTDGAAGDVTFSWTTTSVNMGLIQGYKTASGGGTAATAIDFDGSATMTASGASLASATISAAGAATATLGGASLASSVISAAGQATGTFEGSTANQFVETAMSMAGSATTTLHGASLASGAASAAGAALARLVGAGGSADDAVTTWGARPRGWKKRLKQMEAEELAFIRSIAPELIRRARRGL